MRIETERLQLRPLRVSDAAYYERLGEQITPEEARLEVDDAAAHWEKHGFGPWAVLERASGRFVGAVEIHYAGPGVEGISPDEIEIGCSVESTARGRGIATEGLRAVVDHAFGRMGIRQLVAYVWPSNAPSLRLLKGLGMRDEGEGRTRSGERMRIFRLDRADYHRQE